MFDFLKRKLYLYAPADGEIITLAQVPDKVFASGMVGDGVAVLMTGNRVVAPCAGVISVLANTRHAFGITTPEGLEVLVHIGMDTVELKGEGFMQLAKTGDRVEQGTPVIEFDRELLQSKGFALITPMVITNMDKVKMLLPLCGPVRAGSTAAAAYSLK